MMDRGAHKWFGSEFGDRPGVRQRLAVLMLPALAMALVAAGGDPLRALMRYERTALAAGQWWRLVTAHFVHLDARHLLFNLAGLLLLWLLFAREFSLRHWLAILLSSMLAIDAGLWFGSPQVVWYVGASGVLHGIWSAGGWAQWRRSSPATAVPLLALLLKLVIEQWRGASIAAGDLPVVLEAHAYGAIGGLLPPLLWQLWRSSRARPL